MIVIDMKCIFFRAYSDPPATPVTSSGPGYISGMGTGMPTSPALFNTASSSKFSTRFLTLC